MKEGENRVLVSIPASLKMEWEMGISYMISYMPNLPNSRNGWWRFESRNNDDLEEAFRGGKQQVKSVMW